MTSIKPAGFIRKPLLYLPFLGAVILWLVLGFGPSAYLGYDEADKLADSFGTVNALFSALAFAGVIVAILLQREELQLQRQELEETREELKRSADAQIQTERSIYFSAYLNTISAALSSYTPAFSESDQRFQPGKLSHHVLMMELEWLLTHLRTEKSPPVAVPTRTQAIKIHLSHVGRHFYTQASHRLKEKDVGALSDMASRLRGDLLGLLGLIDDDDDDKDTPFLRMAVEEAVELLSHGPNFPDPKTANADAIGIAIDVAAASVSRIANILGRIG